MNRALSSVSLTHELAHPDIITILEDLLKEVRDVSLVRPKRRMYSARVGRVTEVLPQAIKEHLAVA